MLKNNFPKSLLVVSLALTFVISPALASAQTAQDLQAKVQALLQQIGALQAQLKTIKQSDVGSSQTSCHNFNVNLSIGSYGEDVSALTTILVKEGVMSERGSNFSSSYDEITASGVTGFQEKYKSEILIPNGLRYGTGFVGKATRAKLNALYGCSIPIDVTSSVIIKGVSGPHSLNVNQQGTWSVTASAPNDANLSYSVVWGDEPISYGANRDGLPSLVTQQSATFTHSYSQAGTYNPTFTVTNSNTRGGQDAKTSLSVNVGNISNIPRSITVLSPNGGETWRKGTIETIKWQDNGAAPAYDIVLESYPRPCTGHICEPTVQYTLAKGVSGSSYNWTVGNILNGMGPNDGAYTIRVCQNDTYICDSSDSHFKTISGTSTTIPAEPYLSVPSSVSAGSILIVTFAGVSSPTVLDWIGLYAPTDIADNTYRDWQYTSSCAKAAGGTAVSSGSCSFVMPTVPGNYEFRLFANNVYTRYATSKTIAVVSSAPIDSGGGGSGGGGSSRVCPLANPPAGYHYEDIKPYPECGGYLVPDGTLNTTSSVYQSLYLLLKELSQSLK